MKLWDLVPLHFSELVWSMPHAGPKSPVAPSLPSGLL